MHLPNDNLLWHTKLKVAGQWVKFKLDTGSQANVLPRDIVNRMKIQKMTPPRCSLITFSGQQVTPDREVQCKARGTDLTFQVVLKGHPILGETSFCQARTNCENR